MLFFYFGLGNYLVNRILKHSLVTDFPSYREFLRQLHRNFDVECHPRILEVFPINWTFILPHFHTLVTIFLRNLSLIKLFVDLKALCKRLLAKQGVLFADFKVPLFLQIEEVFYYKENTSVMVQGSEAFDS